MKIVILQILLLMMVSAQRNYHERIIYYSAQDNACTEILSTDYIDLTINFNDTVLVEIKQISGHTDCDQRYIIPSSRIQPSDNWYFLN